MENASKALMIASAVMISIAIISIGVMVYNAVRSTINNIDVDSVAVSTHNSRFVTFIGEMTGVDVKRCIQNVLANNFNDNTATEYKVEVSIVQSGSTVDYVKFTNATKTGSGRQTVCNQMSTNIKENYRYQGVVSYSSNGIITKIVFTRI